METKLILAAVSLAFGVTLLVMSSVLIRHTQYSDKPYRARIDAMKSSGVKLSEGLKEYEDNYNGVQAAYSLALIAALLQILSFVMVCVKDDLWLPWTGIHVGAFVFTLIACIVAICYKVQTSPDSESSGTWQNVFYASFWGLAFVIVVAFDAIFSIAAAIGAFMIK